MLSVRTTSILAVAAALAAAACEQSTPVGTDGSAAIAAPEPAARTLSAPIASVPHRGYAFPLRVMTRNVYLGAPIGPLLQAPSTQVIPGLVADMWATVQATDFPSRAALLADEIERQRPHVIGLQEAAQYRIQSPGDFLIGNPQAATEVVYDFIELLEQELIARGLDYTTVVVRFGSDVELPSMTGDDLRLIDRQAILVRSGVKVVDSDQGTYAVNVTLPVGGEGGPPVTLSRGWVSVDAEIAGRTTRFVCTHLERGSVAPVQMAQGAELLQRVAAAPVPVVVLGDLNSAADGSTTDTYGTLVAGGLVDVWAQARPRDSGHTCCHDDDLLNSAVDFNRRIDLVLLHRVGEPIVIGASRAVVVGADPEYRSDAGLWPSDHAGAAVTLAVRASRGWLRSRPGASTAGMTVSSTP